MQKLSHTVKCTVGTTLIYSPDCHNYLAPLVKVAWWKKLMCTNSHHTANLNFPAKELTVRLLFWFL